MHLRAGEGLAVPQADRLHTHILREFKNLREQSDRKQTDLRQRSVQRNMRGAEAWKKIVKQAER